LNLRDKITGIRPDTGENTEPGLKALIISRLRIALAVAPKCSNASRKKCPARGAGHFPKVRLKAYFFWM
jgi:hypothetical protein